MAGPFVARLEGRTAAVSLGEIPDTRYFRRTGRHVVLSEAVSGWTSCWLRNPTKQQLFHDRSSDSNATKVEVVSSSPSDTLLGTGARRVRIIGIRQDGLYRGETLDLNGGTPVLTSQKYFSVDLFEVIEAGSAGEQVGQLNASAEGTTDFMALMSTLGGPVNFMEGCAFSFPDDAVGLVWLAAQGGADDVRHRVRVRDKGGVWQVRAQQESFLVGHAPEDVEASGDRVGIFCAAGSQMEVQNAAASGGAQVASCTIDVLMIPLTDGVLIG